MRLLPLALLAACHATAPVSPAAPLAVSVATSAPTVAPAPVVAETVRPVAYVSQPTAILALGADIVTTDMARDAFVRVPMAGGEAVADVRGVGHYPPRLLPDGDGGWMCVGASRDWVMHVTARGMHTPIVASQPIVSIARDADWLYVLAGNAPNLRRVPRRDAQGRLIDPDRARDLAEGMVNVPGAVDLAAIGGDVYLATQEAVVHARAGSPPRRLGALPAPASVMTVDAEDVFVGTEGGAVVRVARGGGPAVELGRIEDRVASIHVDGAFVYAGGAHGLVAFERSRGVRVPIVARGAIHGVTTSAGRVWFADYVNGAVYSAPIPALPVREAQGEAREVGAQAPRTTSHDAPDNDPLAGRSSSSEHTVVVRFGTTADAVAREAASRLVTRVVASGLWELWARVTDAQYRALEEQGFTVAMRDGVDRLRCADVRLSPARVRRAPPRPWHVPSTPRAFLVQLGATSSAFEGLMDTLASHGVTLVETEPPATLLVVGTTSAVARFSSRLPGVTFVAGYGPFERLQIMAATVVTTGADGAVDDPCGPDPDARLRALAAWMAEAPSQPVELGLTLFRPSRALEAAVVAWGGTVRSGAGEESLVVRVPRRALAMLGDADDVRSIEPVSEPTAADAAGHAFASEVLRQRALQKSARTR